ncbi:hypothetical protein [Lysobacter gummosus]|uniref:hypothetical protein n=1 Tax=Lysobacter gummosus TaxID=262324 RepID=UPI003636B86C
MDGSSKTTTDISKSSIPQGGSAKFVICRATGKRCRTTASENLSKSKIPSGVRLFSSTIPPV